MAANLLSMHSTAKRKRVEEEDHVVKRPMTHVMDESPLECKIRDFVDHKNGQIHIPPSVLVDMKQVHSASQFEAALSNLIKRRLLLFPYKRYFMSDPKVRFEKLMNYKQEVSTAPCEIPTLQLRSKPELGLIDKTFRGTFCVLTSKPEDYEQINSLSDTFQEHCRVKSVAGKGVAPYSIFYGLQHHQKFLPRFVEEALRSPSKGMSASELREVLFAVTHETSTFKTTVAKYIIQRFGTRVLDFSSGWGDRLCGAVSLQDHLDFYVGVDPNWELQRGYAAMIKQLATPNNVSKYIMIESPFEVCDVVKHVSDSALFKTSGSPNSPVSFDLVFTSPPYFDYELYGDGKKSSTTSFPVFEDWVEKFLFQSLCKAWALLDDKGHLALSIGDTGMLLSRGQAYVEATVLFMHCHLPHAVSQGMICFSGAKVAKTRPIWIFRKNSSFWKQHQTHMNLQREKTRKEFNRCYPRLFERLKRHETHCLCRKSFDYSH